MKPSDSIIAGLDNQSELLHTVKLKSIDDIEQETLASKAKENSILTEEQERDYKEYLLEKRFEKLMAERKKSYDGTTKENKGGNYTLGIILLLAILMLLVHLFKGEDNEGKPSYEDTHKTGIGGHRE